LKFLCENCRAKYQIADEKVAGRTVRMKCRKCGHLIEVEASVTESSTVSKAPPAPARPVGMPGAVGARPPTSADRAVEGRSSWSSEAESPGAPAAASDASPRPAGAAAGGLAGAFSKAVALPKERLSAASAASAVLSSSRDTEEWYVGINGVPVGPVRLTELRRKAAAGAITPDSLVWREGFEEWVPLRTFPELLAMLREAVSGSRMSLTPTPPPPSRALAGVARGAPLGLGARSQPTPRPPPPSTARSPGASVSSRRAESLEDLTFSAQEEPVALRFDEGEPAKAQTEPGAMFADASAAQSIAPASAIAGLRVARARPTMARRIPPGAVIAVLVSMLLGMAIMVLLETRRPSGVQIVSVPIPMQTVAAPNAPVATEEGVGATTIGAIEIGAAAQKAGGGAARAGKAPEAPGGAAAPANTGLTGLGGLVGGPAAPGGGSPSGGGGGQLAAADVERVVQSHRAFVKRQCWEAALAARPPNAPSSVRVAVSITVGSDGRVQSTSASGGDAYPGLSSCVQSQVRNWTFPRSDGATVTVPFVFASQ
jgi:predicted Zn finger-like uncharacterized protein